MSDEDDDLPRPLTCREVAAILRLSPKGLRNRVAKGLEPQPMSRGARGERLLWRREDVRRYLYRGAKSGRPQGGER